MTTIDKQSILITTINTNQYSLPTQQPNNFIMSIANKLHSLNKAIEQYTDSKFDHSVSIDSIELLSFNTSRPKTSATLNKHTKVGPDKISILKKSLDEHREQALRNLFEARCDDLEIHPNESNWHSFLETFIKKNPATTQQKPTNPEVSPSSPTRQRQKSKLKAQTQSHCNQLDLSDLNLTPSCEPHLNLLLNMCTRIKLSKNLINPNHITFYPRLSELVLCNCSLGNEALESLFQKIVDERLPIYKLVLSSPELINRNQLTRYDSLCNMIRSSTTLYCLQLSNIQIKPNNGILSACRNSSVKVVDLSKNSGVEGICPTLLSLNLSMNDITTTHSLTQNENILQSLDISYNGISHYMFKNFLKTSFYTELRSLNLEGIRISGEVGALQQFLQKSRLAFLSVKNCQLTAQSFSNVALGLYNNKFLKELVLSDNHLPSYQQAVQLNECLTRSQLVILRMSACDIRDEYGQVLFRKLHYNSTLEQLDLHRNYLNIKSSAKLVEELKSNHHLERINLAENFIKYDHMKEIREYLDRNIYNKRLKMKSDWEQLQELKSKELELQKQINDITAHKQKSEREKISLELECDRKMINCNRIDQTKMEAELEVMKKKEEAIRKTVDHLIEEVNQIQDQEEREKQQQQEEKQRHKESSQLPSQEADETK